MLPRISRPSLAWSPPFWRPSPKPSRRGAALRPGRPGFRAGGLSGRIVPTTTYHAAFGEFYDGDYRAALDRFKSKARGAIKTVQRAVDRFDLLRNDARRVLLPDGRQRRGEASTTRPR